MADRDRMRRFSTLYTYIGKCTSDKCHPIETGIRMTQRPKSQILKQTASIDRKAHEPAYSQLANILSHSMATGILRPGDQLPSEAQLCERYDVSPMTVRRAINLLVDQGFVVAEQGRGTFVKPVAMGAATFQLRDSAECVHRLRGDNCTCARGQDRWRR